MSYTTSGSSYEATKTIQDGLRASRYQEEVNIFFYEKREDGSWFVMGKVPGDHPNYFIGEPRSNGDIFADIASWFDNKSDCLRHFRHLMNEPKKSIEEVTGSTW